MPAANARAASVDQAKQALRLWLRLLSCENMMEARIRTALKEKFGITLPQFDVLAELDRMGRPLTMTQLSQRLMVSNGNVTGVVDRLAREGYVKRTASPADRRVHHIALTDKGAEAFRSMAREHQAWVSTLLAGLPAADVDALLALLTRTHELLKSAGEAQHP